MPEKTELQQKCENCVKISTLTLTLLKMGV